MTWQAFERVRQHAWDCNVAFYYVSREEVLVDRPREL
jgi:hypothetical protein